MNLLTKKTKSKMMNRHEISLDFARKLVEKDKIVYVVLDMETKKIIKIFDYHTQAANFIQGTNFTWHNITHPKCPRFAKLELGYINQYDLFLDYKGI